MADIFGRVTDLYGGSFSADGAAVTFSQDLGLSLDPASFTETGLLLQQLQVQYTQNILRMYEIGSLYSFLIAGRTQGQMSLNRVLGPRPVSLAFYVTFGDVCNAATNIIALNFQAGCGLGGAGGDVEIAALYCVINNLGISTQAENALITESVSLMFCSMYLATNDPSGASAGNAAAIAAIDAVEAAAGKDGGAGGFTGGIGSFDDGAPFGGFTIPGLVIGGGVIGPD
jgi:hypothetical protein